ncbi:MAG: hypothetical protein JXR70_00570 [Spirochaetales bacterium]|nr:hypothetical protein [Spirochaetales bacterium]
MADDDSFLEDEETGGSDDVEVGQKVGFLPAIVIKILQWLAIIALLIILIVTISYFMFQNLIKGTVTQPPQSISEQYSNKKEMYAWFNNLDTIRGLTADKPAKNFIASVSIGYVPGNNAVQQELLDRRIQIQNLILIHLGSKEAEELSISNAEKLQNELKEMIIELMIERINVVLFNELQAF